MPGISAQPLGEKPLRLGKLPAFERKALSNGVTVEIDLYSPREFSGLGDFEHFANFQKALASVQE